MHKGCTTDCHARCIGPPIEEQWRRKRRVYDDHQAGAQVELRAESGVWDEAAGGRRRPNLPDKPVFGVTRTV